jgi:hypothetical protein
MSFDFVKSVVKEIEQFEDDWIADEVTHMYLISEGPAAFHSILKSTFPSMTAPLRGLLFKFYKGRMIEENMSPVAGFLLPELAKLWLVDPGAGEIVPQKLFNPTEPPALVFGQQNAFLRGQPPAHQGKPSASMLLGQNASGVPSMSGHLQGPPPSLNAASFQSPPAAMPAREVGLGLRAGQNAGVRANAGGGAEHQSLPGGGASIELTAEQQFDASRALFHAHGLTLSASTKTPWAVRADSKVQTVQDPTMPFGFDKVCIHDKIAKAVADRLAKGAVGIHQNVKKVTWPSMSEFDSAGFNACRVAYYECVLASLTSAIFQDFKDCLDGIARLAACITFQLSDNDFSELPDAEFMRWCDATPRG